MQVSENDSVILYYSQLRGEWPAVAATHFTAALAYGKRLALTAKGEAGRASLVGVSLARRALSAVIGADVPAGALAFPDGRKPHLAPDFDLEGSDFKGAVLQSVDFSIAHSGPWVGCAAVARGKVGFDVECAQQSIEQTLRLMVPAAELQTLNPQTALARWVATEAALKALGASVREAPLVTFENGRPRYRGMLLHRREIGVFEGAAACVVTTEPVGTVVAHEVPLSELF